MRGWMRQPVRVVRLRSVWIRVALLRLAPLRSANVRAALSSVVQVKSASVRVRRGIQQQAGFFLRHVGIRICGQGQRQGFTKEDPELADEGEACLGRLESG